MHTRLSLSASVLVLAAACAALPAYRVFAADRVTIDRVLPSDQTTPTEKKAKPDKPDRKEKKDADRKASSDAKKKMTKALQSGDVKDSGLYELGPDELAMDCKRMAGSIKITISRLRDAQTRKGGSAVAEAAHKTMPMILGGSTAAADRQATLVRERAKIDAYNRQLAAKNCKTLDIDAELARMPEGPKKY